LGELNRIKTFLINTGASVFTANVKEDWTSLFVIVRNNPVSLREETGVLRVEVVKKLRIKPFLDLIVLDFRLFRMDSKRVRILGKLGASQKESLADNESQS